eukprot:TRINITY_DN86_c0_g1_i2.p2 TRINITY_DN86_c0_g1~~TRINITY_DN86_c0_g1_i2.p2  ORF type:complete len:117 (-),score=64.98 TRINITY_DN86_c0_g1_i2:39-389(-)
MVKQATGLPEVATRETTIHVHKMMYGVTLKKRAPTAIKKIVKFVQREMNTVDVRLDPKLNKAIWSQGIKNVPRRLRVRMSRQRSEDEEGKSKLFTLVTPVEVESFKGLQHVNVEEN